MEERCNLLMVEDNRADVRLVQEMLKQESDILFELQTSGTVGSALSLLANGSFHAILLDLSLPDSHGINTLATIRARAPNVPVIVLTSSDDKRLAVAALEHGAEDYLIKGQFDADTLRRGVRYAITRHRRTLAQQGNDKGSPLATVIGVVGAKGGSGTSTIALHLALELRQQTIQKVLLADLDLNGNTLGFLMKANVPHTMADVFVNLHRMDATLFGGLVSKHSSGVHVLQSPGPTGLGLQPQDGAVRQVLRLSQSLYSWIVLDMGRLNELSIALMGQIGELLLVTTTDIVAMYEAQRAIQKLGEHGRLEHLSLVMNRTSKNWDVNVKELEETLGMSIQAVCCDSSRELQAAYAAGKLLEAGSPIRTELGAIVARWTGTESVRPVKRSFFGLR